MKRIVFLAAFAVCAIGLFSGSALARSGHYQGHHHHGVSVGHGHYGFHVGHVSQVGRHFGHASHVGRHFGHASHVGRHFGHASHVGRHVGHASYVGRHVGYSGLHLSFGLGHGYDFGHYGYRSTYSASRYSYPRYGYSFSRYSYPTYRTYSYPSCTSYRVIQLRPAPVAPAEPAEPQQRPKIDPPPEPLPAVPEREADAPALGTVKFAVLRNTTKRQYTGQAHSVTPTGSSPDSAAAGQSAQLGPQLSSPKSHSLVADKEVPWVVE